MFVKGQQTAFDTFQPTKAQALFLTSACYLAPALLLQQVQYNLMLNNTYKHFRLKSVPLNLRKEIMTGFFPASIREFFATGLAIGLIPILKKELNAETELEGIGVSALSGMGCGVATQGFHNWTGVHKEMSITKKINYQESFREVYKRLGYSALYKGAISRCTVVVIATVLSNIFYTPLLRD